MANTEKFELSREFMDAIRTMSEARCRDRIADLSKMHLWMDAASGLGRLGDTIVASWRAAEPTDAMASGIGSEWMETMVRVDCLAMKLGLALSSKSYYLNHAYPIDAWYAAHHIMSMLAREIRGNGFVRDQACELASLIKSMCVLAVSLGIDPDRALTQTTRRGAAG